MENDVLNCVVEVTVKQFAKFCKDKKKNADELGIALLETELLEFLFIIFDKDNYQMEEMEGAENIKAIELVKQCIGRADILNGLLECIYNAYYLRMTGGEPGEAEWKFLKNNMEGFERILSENLKKLDKAKVSKEYQRDYCFNMRDLNRLCGAWWKCKENEDDAKVKNELWKACIVDIRKKIGSGFEENKGFTELYRILNMIFGHGDDINIDEEKKSRRVF